MTSRRRLVITLSLLIGTVLSSLDVTVVGTAMPTIVAELGGLSLYGWVFAGYLLTSTTVTPLYGKLADRIGRKRAFSLAISVFLVGSLVCGQADSMEMLVVGRLVKGLGGGGLIPITVTVFGDLYPPEQRARVQGFVALVWGLSSVIGPAVGALILSVTTWPWIFYLNLPVGGLAMLALWVTLDEKVERSTKPMDITGAVVLTVGVASLLLGIQMIEGEHALVAAAFFSIAAVLTAVFIVVERRASDPIIPLSFFSDPPIRVGALACVFISGVLFSVIAYAPLIVRGVHGKGPLAIGAAFIPMSFAWTMGSFLSGTVIKRLGYRSAVRIGGSCTLVGSSLFALTSLSSWFWLMVPASALVGIGFGLTLPSLNIVVQERVPWNQRGSVTALLQFARSIGGAIWVAALGLLMTSRLASGLAGDVDGETLSLVLDPAQWAALEPAFVARAQDALRDALLWTFGATALIGSIGTFALFAFPDVRLGQERRREDPAPS